MKTLTKRYFYQDLNFMHLPGRDVLLHVGPFSTKVTEKINP